MRMDACPGPRLAPVRRIRRQAAGPPRFSGGKAVSGAACILSRLEQVLDRWDPGEWTVQENR